MAESGWLIEDETLGRLGPLYWNGQKWTFDHMEGLRLARKEDGERLARIQLPGRRVRVVEHQWEDS